MPRLAWITGAGGLIGSNLVREAATAAPDWHARPLTRNDFDLTDFSAVERAFRSERPDLVIHCAALSRSPECEANPERARLLNLEVTRVLSELARDAAFIFFSTDLVFDGQTGQYPESAAVNPLSVYGETKALAEQIVLGNPRHCVVRTSLNGGVSPTGDRGFNEQLRRAWAKGQKTRLFRDEFRSPICAQITARATWELAKSGSTGVIHIAGSERLARSEIGHLVASRCPELKPQIEETSLRDYSGPSRPPDTSLNCEKIQKILPFKLPGLAEWLREHPAVSF